MHTFKGLTMYDVWQQANLSLYNHPPEDAAIVGRDFGMTVSPVILQAEKGFGLPPSDHWTVMYRDMSARSRKLAGRYRDPDLWEEGVQNLRNLDKRHNRQGMSSATLMFHREKKKPSGGGCLIAMTIVQEGRTGISLHVHSRAVEGLKFLPADLYFMEDMVTDWALDADAREILQGLEKITWTFSVFRQSRVYWPLFLFVTQGDEGLRNWAFTEAQNKWQAYCVRYWWRRFIWPEDTKLKFKQRTSRYLFDETGFKFPWWQEQASQHVETLPKLWGNFISEGWPPRPMKED